MIFEHQSKNKKILLIAPLAVLAIGFLVFMYSPVIFQEGSPWSEIKAISQLTFGGSDMVKLSGSDNKYLTKSQGGPQVINVFMKDRGYKFTDQMGSGYFYKSSDKTVVLTRLQYSRFYTIWNITETNNADLIEWLEYKNEEYAFVLDYPSVSVDNYLWGNLTETMPLSEILLPNQVLSKDNNFYLHQQYSLKKDEQTGAISKTENTFMPEYDGSYSYPLAWHIIILDVNNESNLDEVIKKKLGPGCKYKSKIPTNFDGNYQIEIDGDGKDLGDTLCPVNYQNYIVYSPDQKKVAFWSTGQECQIGLGFMANNCFDRKISESFHFYGKQKTLADELRECLPKSDTASHKKCTELLKQITDYDYCVDAGFSIMKSNPPQCATPDGRTFVENKK